MNKIESGNNMNVALCMFGQPRVIRNDFTFNSHQEHIIKKYNPDIYCHSWISKEPKEFEYSDWVNPIRRSVEDSFASEIILEKYKPKHFLFEEPRIFSLEGKSRELAKNSGKCPLGVYYWSENNEHNLISQLYSISKVIKMSSQSKYDWVILSRYDNYIENIPSLYDLDSNNLYLSNHFPHFVDVLMMGGQEQMNTIDCYDDIDGLCSEINYFTPEEFKRASFNRKFEREVRVDISVGIARTNTLEGLQK